MTSRARLLAGLLTSLALTVPLTLAHAAPMTEPAARGKAVAVSPSPPMKGERTRFSGRYQGRATSAALERKKGKRWVTLARGKVKKGRYQVTAKVRKAGTYRIRAGAFTSRRVKVRLAPQGARFAAGAPFVTGLTRSVTATVTPARAGRTVHLQRLDGTAWTTVATATTDTTGHAALEYAGGPAGTTSYRVLADGHRGSASVASAPQPVRTAAVVERLSPGLAPAAQAFSPAISADGRWTAFTAQAPLLPSDTDGANDIYLFDRATGRLSHVLPALTGHMNEPALSGDGRFLAFQTLDPSLAGEADHDYDVFVLDRASGAVDLVSRAHESSTPADDDSYLSDISDDGRVVSFTSYASDLVSPLIAPSDTTVRHAYVRDRTARSTAALDLRGLTWGTDNIFDADLSSDGTRVVFDSSDAALDPGDVDQSAVFARDIAANGNVGSLVNLTPDVEASLPALTGSGDEVVFSTPEPLVAGDLNGSDDAYLRTVTGGHVRVGPLGANGGHLAISSDGGTVAMATRAVVAGDTNGTDRDVVVWDRASRATRLVTAAGDGPSDEPRLSADGSVLVLGSQALLAPGVTGEYEVFGVVLR